MNSQQLIDQYAHALNNLILPDAAYQIAERLKDNPEYRREALLLYDVAHAEKFVKLQCEMLRQRHGNINPESFRRVIRSCRRNSDTTDSTRNFSHILDYAATRVAYRLLNQYDARFNSVRDKVFSKTDVKLDILKQKFEDHVLINKTSSSISWLNENVRPVLITEISPLWMKVLVLSESFSEALLLGYFSEILVNAFKYADHYKDEFLTIVFSDKVIDGKTYLICGWSNPIGDTLSLGSGKGLDAIREDLKQLNDSEVGLTIAQNDGKHQVTLFFNKELLINDMPPLRIKRKGGTVMAN